MILLVSALVELIGGTTTSGTTLLLLHVTQDVLFGDILLARGRSTLQALRLFWDCLEGLLGCLSEGLALLSLDLALLLSNCVLILAEVSAVQGLQLWEPDLDGGTELGILLL